MSMCTADDAGGVSYFVQNISGDVGLGCSDVTGDVRRLFDITSDVTPSGGDVAGDARNRLKVHYA